MSAAPASRASRAVRVALCGAVAAVSLGCAFEGAERPTTDHPAAASDPVTVQVPSPAPTAAATPTAAPTPDQGALRTEPARLTIPAIGVKGLKVVPYEGTTDDGPGTDIQDRGIAASPYGQRGGAGPGQVGNYLVTAHRLAAGGPLRELPSVGIGDKVRVSWDGTVYEYRITELRKTSFRSERSLAEQRAAVPGRPGEQPVKAMITISTCATPEDHAAGNYWSDEHGNPEHRIDRVGVLVSVSEP
ncbi:class E sortase [Streptomyces sp. NPDC127084]|uniref:class E sortase n=1 Tax=Streptomyces sp. NPDC127084 TaxID=3347133 RepID=UPI00365E6594